MFCPNCGHKIEGEVKFCPQCGTAVGGVPGARKAVSSRWLRIVGVVGGVVLIIVIAALLIGGESPHASPEAVVSSFLIAVYEKCDSSQCLELIDPQALAQVQLEAGVGMDEIREVLQAFLDEIQQEVEIGASISFEVGRTELQNGRAETAVTLKSSHPVYGHEESADTLATVERDGRWYLYGFADESVVDWLLSSLPG